MVRIYSKLRESYLTVPMEQAVQLGMEAMARTKQLVPERLFPMLVRAQATTLVAREMLVEAISARFQTLSAAVTERKAQIVLRVKGAWEEAKLMERVNRYGSEFKDLVVKVKQSGVEMWMQREDLVRNYHTAMEKVERMLEYVKEESSEKWVATKRSGLEMYEEVLRRIKEKEVQIVTRYRESSEVLPLALTAESN